MPAQPDVPRASDPSHPDQSARLSEVLRAMKRAGMDRELDKAKYDPAWHLGADERSIVVQAKDSRIGPVLVNVDGTISLHTLSGPRYTEDTPGDLSYAAICHWLGGGPRVQSDSVDHWLHWQSASAGPDEEKSLPERIITHAMEDLPFHDVTELSKVRARHEVIAPSAADEDALIAQTGLGADPESGLMEVVTVTLSNPDGIPFHTVIDEDGDLRVEVETLTELVVTLRFGRLPYADIPDLRAPDLHSFPMYSDDDHEPVVQLLDLDGYRKGEKRLSLRSRPGLRSGPRVGESLDIEDSLDLRYICSDFHVRWGVFSHCADAQGKTVSVVRLTLDVLLWQIMSTVLREEPRSLAFRLAECARWTDAQDFHIDHHRLLLGDHVIETETSMILNQSGVFPA